jgi:hypothetical protein
MRWSDFKGLDLMVSLSNHEPVAVRRAHREAWAASYFRSLLADATSHEVHTALTDNGAQYVNRKRDNNALEPLGAPVANISLNSR